MQKMGCSAPDFPWLRQGPCAVFGSRFFSSPLNKWDRSSDLLAVPLLAFVMLAGEGILLNKHVQRPEK